MKKIILTIFSMMLLVSGCGAPQKYDIDDYSFASTNYNYYYTPEIKDGYIEVPKSLVSDLGPLFVNYLTDNYFVQLIFVKDSNGNTKIGLNTCYECSPDPRAYFRKKAGQIICETCGIPLDVDEEWTEEGCHPVSIDYEETDTSYIFKTDVLDDMSVWFDSWEGITG